MSLMETYTANSKIFCDAVAVLGYSYYAGCQSTIGRFNTTFDDFNIRRDNFNFQFNVMDRGDRDELMEARWEQLFSVAALNKGLAKEPDETNLDFAKRIIKGRNSISMKWQSCAIL